MTDPAIVCPHCKTEIKLTESLAAPLVDSVRKDYEQRLSQKDAAFSQREALLKEQEQKLAQSQAALEEHVAERVAKERSAIATDESKKAKLLAALELEQKTKDVHDLQQLLEDRNTKLAEAQKSQAETLKKERALDDAKRELVSNCNNI